MAYKNAFKCSKCPETNGAHGCPCWIELTWENDHTGEKSIEKGCYFQMIPKLMLQVVKSADVASEHACQARNSFQNGFTRMTQALEHAYQQGVEQYAGNKLTE